MVYMVLVSDACVVVIELGLELEMYDRARD